MSYPTIREHPLAPLREFVHERKPRGHVRAHRQPHRGSKVSAIERYAFSAAPPSMRMAAESFQSRYGIAFETLTYFPKQVLAALHAKGTADDVRTAVVIASESDPEILTEIMSLTRVANESDPTLADRAAYFASLQNVYRRLQPSMAGDDLLVVAPEREGRILAERLGWLRPHRDLAPHAKRIPYEHGLLVGISECEPLRMARRLAFVDGAIASGATMIALLELLGSPDTPVDIYSVHAATEGLRAIAHFADASGLTVRMHVGHATEGLSPKYYAISRPSGRLIVGDLGDMIEMVAPSRCAS